MNNKELSINDIARIEKKIDRILELLARRDPRCKHGFYDGYWGGCMACARERNELRGANG